jgi:hypothetical protein
MLLRAALVIALARDGRDDAGLVVIPADGRDVGEGAELRACAVTGDREAQSPMCSETGPYSFAFLLAQECKDCKRSDFEGTNDRARPIGLAQPRRGGEQAAGPSPDHADRSLQSSFGAAPTICTETL